MSGELWKKRMDLWQGRPILPRLRIAPLKRKPSFSTRSYRDKLSRWGAYKFNSKRSTSQSDPYYASPYYTDDSNGSPSPIMSRNIRYESPAPMETMSPGCCEHCRLKDRSMTQPIRPPLSEWQEPEKTEAAQVLLSLGPHQHERVRFPTCSISNLLNHSADDFSPKRVGSDISANGRC